MTNPAASIPLTFDGTDVQHADFGIFLEIVEGLDETPEVRGEDTRVPARDGLIARNRRPERLPLRLHGCVRGTDGDDDAALKSDFRTNMLAVRTLFRPHRDPAALVAQLEDGQTATINARPLNIVINPIIQSLYHEIDIALESVDPDWEFST